MARKSLLTKWTEYLGLRTLTGCLHCLDVEQNLRIAAAVGAMYYAACPGRMQRAKDHIQRAFPDRSPTDVEAIALKSCQHMFQIFMVDAIVMPRLITAATWPRYVTLDHLEPVVDRLVKRKPMIFVTGHFGNWEMLGYTVAVAGFPLYAVARPMDNPLINAWLLSIREARGMRIVTKWGAGPQLQQAMRSGGRIGFIADQNAGEQGLFVPFFGRLASSYKSIALLAMRYEVPVAVGSAIRDSGADAGGGVSRAGAGGGGGFHFTIRHDAFIHPDEWADHDDPQFYITARYNRAIEDMVRRNPEQYLWLHRRWKSRPRFEREGKPMPRRLLRKLESLPWMTDDELRRIVDDAGGVADV